MLLILCSTFSLSFGQLSQGQNHFQTYGGTWKQADGSRLRFEGSHQNERVLYEFDMETKSYRYLSDSLEKYTKRYYFNSDTGYATDNNFKTYVTYDSFKTMTLVPTGTYVTDIYKTSTGYLGYKKTSSTVDIHYTTDLINWTKVTSQAAPGSTSFNLVFLGNRIYAINQCNHYLLSTDGGASFLKVNTSNNSDYFLELIGMPDTATIFARTSTQLLLSTDAGKNWTKTNFPFGYGVFYFENLDSIYYTNPIGTKKDTLFLSLDTGKTHTHYMGGLDPRVSNKRVRKFGDYYMVDQNAMLVYSKNLFGDWQETPLYQNGKYCIDMNGSVGLSGGDNGKYSFSRDGGRTFQNGTIANAKDIKACKVLNDSLMLVSDRESDIYKSTDGGLTWNKTYNSTTVYIGRKFVANDDLSRIILFRSTGGALISTDQGDTWKTLSGQAGVFGSITPNDKIYVAQQVYDNSSGTLLIKQSVEEVSVDGTRTQIKQFTEDSLAQAGLIMFDNTTGYYFAVKESSSEVLVFGTSDAWSTYSLKGKISNLSFNSLFGYQLDLFTPGKDTLYVHLNHTGGSSLVSNDIYYSYDGGANWAKQEIKPSKYASTDKLAGLYFLDSKHYISTWSLGRLYLNTSLSGNAPNQDTTGNNGGSNAVDIVQKDKSQVYPNPVKQVLKVKLNADQGSLELIDLSGKTILTQSIMSEDTRLDLSGLKKGIYLLRIKTVNGLETHRVLKE